MIVEFKLFEGVLKTKKQTCYKVPSRYLDEFGGSLVSIGMSEEEILFWTSKRYKAVSNYNHIYLYTDTILILTNPSTNKAIWTWSSSPPNDDDDFKGLVEPTQEDIDAWEFLRQTEKYNL